MELTRPQPALTQEVPTAGPASSPTMEDSASTHTAPPPYESSASAGKPEQSDDRLTVTTSEDTEAQSPERPRSAWRQWLLCPDIIPEVTIVTLLMLRIFAPMMEHLAPNPNLFRLILDMLLVQIVIGSVATLSYLRLARARRENAHRRGAQHRESGPLSWALMSSMLAGGTLQLVQRAMDEQHGNVNRPKRSHEPVLIQHSSERVGCIHYCVQGLKQEREHVRGTRKGTDQNQNR